MGRTFPTIFVGGPPKLDTPRRNVARGGINWLLRDSLRPYSSSGCSRSYFASARYTPSCFAMLCL